MPQAIMVKYLPATSTKGSRFKAVANGMFSITIPYDYALNAYENQEKAARALCDKYGFVLVPGMDVDVPGAHVFIAKEVAN